MPAMGVAVREWFAEMMRRVTLPSAVTELVYAAHFECGVSDGNQGYFRLQEMATTCLT